MLSGHALYLCQVSWNYLKRYQSYRADTISILKITKGNNSAKNVGGVTVVNLCTSSGHALYFYQVLRNYLKRYQSYRADTISILKITKGNNSAKNVGGVTVVNLCTSSGHALYFYQVLWNYLKRYQSYRADTISILKISKGNNSAKNVGGVTVVNLCTSSDHGLYLYQVSWNYLERYQSYGPDTNVQPLTNGRTDRRTDGRTDTQKFGGYNIISRHFLWRGIKSSHFLAYFLFNKHGRNKVRLSVTRISTSLTILSETQIWQMYVTINSRYLKVEVHPKPLLSHSKFSGSRKFTLRYQ